MAAEDAFRCPVPASAHVGSVRAWFLGQILAGAKVDDPRHQRALVNHDVVRLEVPVHDFDLVVQVLHAEQYLPHDRLDLVLLEALPPLDELRQGHFHLLEHYEEPAVVVSDLLGLHHERTVTVEFDNFVFWNSGCLRPYLIFGVGALMLHEALEDSDLALLEGFRLRLEASLKLFQGDNFSGGNVRRPVYVSEGPRPNHRVLGEGSVQHGPRVREGDIGVDSFALP